jgi:hypothetical protein
MAKTADLPRSWCPPRRRQPPAGVGRFAPLTAARSGTDRRLGRRGRGVSAWRRRSLWGGAIRQRDSFGPETCDNPEASTNEYLALSGDEVNRSGRADADQEGFSKTIATLKVGHDGSLTGRVRSTRPLEGGIKCHSADVALKAKIGGSTK